MNKTELDLYAAAGLHVMQYGTLPQWAVDMLREAKDAKATSEVLDDLDVEPPARGDCE